MNPNLQKLIELDGINQEIARLSEEVAALPKRVAAIEAKTAAAKAEVEAAKAAIKKSDAAKKKQESDIQDWQQKIIKFREQQSAVKTNEQYRALLHEIEYAEKQIGQCEEAILVEMEAAEPLQKRLRAAETELKADQAEVEQEKEHARRLTAEDEARLKELREQRETLRKGIDASALGHYERVAARLKAPIAEARDQKCTLCHVLVRPQRYNELLTGGELISCDSCGRILYYDPAHVGPMKRATVERQWYFLPAAEGQGRFAYLVNAKSGCSMTTYDGASGQRLEAIARKKENYHEAFAAELATAQHLHLQFAPEADEEYLPAEALEELQLQAHIVPSASA